MCSLFLSCSISMWLFMTIYNLGHRQYISHMLHSCIGLAIHISDLLGEYKYCGIEHVVHNNEQKSYKYPFQDAHPPFVTGSTGKTCRFQTNSLILQFHTRTNIDDFISTPSLALQALVTGLNIISTHKSNKLLKLSRRHFFKQFPHWNLVMFIFSVYQYIYNLCVVIHHIQIYHFNLHTMSVFAYISKWTS